MTELHFICPLDALSDPGTLEFSLGEGEWPLRGFVVRHNHEVHAYVNRCPHAGHALNWKPNQFFAPGNAMLVCASHGALFVPHNGECVAGPCVGRQLRQLTVQLIGNQLYLAEGLQDTAQYWT